MRIRIFSLLITIAILIHCNQKVSNLKTEPEKIPKYFINGTDVNFRETPNTKSKVIRRFNKYENIYPILMSKNGHWVNVKTDDLKDGWVSPYYVSLKYNEDINGFFFCYPSDFQKNKTFSIELIGGLKKGKLINSGMKIINDTKVLNIKNLNSYNREGNLSGIIKYLGYNKKSYNSICNTESIVNPSFKFKLISENLKLNDIVLVSNLSNNT